MSIPDWRPIGREIKRRLDDLFDLRPTRPAPSHSDAPSQRKEDALLRGFVYFDTLEEIEEWTPEEVDVIQVSNTPLLPRAVSAESINSTTALKSNVLLCHDYKGSYNEYEAARPTESEYEDYSCEYLRFVDTFIYFSHKLVGCPPPSWINTCHRNGVKILGTFIVEPHSPGIRRILERKNGSFWLAEKLHALGDALGFDGWLLNIEKSFPRTSDISDLLMFVRSLRELMGSSKTLIWYDALTVNNKVNYQNGLTNENLDFAKAAGKLFTNYKWTGKQATSTVELAESEGIKCEDVFFGVDVWAQNTDTDPPRITFPVDGGGGTRTGLAVEKLASLGLSTAIFAPGWTFEHFDASVSRQVERCVWEGGTLPADLKCDCNPKMPHSSKACIRYPINRFAQEFPSTSNSYFYTNFRRSYISHQGRQKSTLGTQAILPYRLPMPRWLWDTTIDKPVQSTIYGEYSSEQSAFTIWTRPGKSEESSMVSSHSLEIFRFAIPVYNQHSLIVSVTYELPQGHDVRDGKFEFVLTYSDATSKVPKLQYEPVNVNPKLPVGHTFRMNYFVRPCKPTSDTLLSSVSVRYTPGDSTKFVGSSIPRRLIILKELSVLPVQDPVEFRAGIFDIQVIEAGNLSTKHKRLAWTWHVLGGGPSEPSPVPWSAVTGPFAYFLVSIEGNVLGDTGTTQFIVRDVDTDRYIDTTTASKETQNVMVTVEGILFTGGSITASKTLPTRNLRTHEIDDTYYHDDPDDWVKV